MAASVFFHDAPRVGRAEARSIAEVLKVLERDDPTAEDGALRRLRAQLREGLAAGSGEVLMDRELCLDACVQLSDLAQLDDARRRLVAAFAWEGVQGRLLEALVSDTLRR